MTIRARRIVVSMGFVVLPIAVGGCDTAASFCSIMRRPHSEFRSSGATDSERRSQIRSLNEIIGELPRGTQRDDVVAVRDYVEVLFGVKTYRSQADQDQDQRKAVQRFFGGASQRLDAALREDCKIDFGGDAPFGYAPPKPTQ